MARSVLSSTTKISKPTVIGVFFLLVLLVIAWSIHRIVPVWVEQQRNTLTGSTPQPVSDRARRLHQELLIADLHGDSLLWGRDLGEASNRGHLDLSRMRRGNLAIEVFSIVSKTPHGLNIHRNTADSDDITRLSIVQGLPPRTWFNLSARVAYHAKRLQRLAANPAHRFRLLTSRVDVSEFLQQRKKDPSLTAGLLSVEGAHALEGRIEVLDEFFNAGIRMVGLAHFFDNAVGGSAHGVKKGGLTAFGRRVIKRMEQRGMFVDLAHSSDKLIDDVLAMAQRPVVVSHTGARGVCNNPRNLTDDQLRRIAATGGLIGIGFWPQATCGKGVAAIVRSLRYVSKLVGINHVALGSDFDGAV
ncbi:MAG TPA: peptidase M19, partial [Acidiferrobacteraceae bacterium]|nr:peptidase M19 [Acidiferrobacteraceae bacterium]